MSDRRELSLRLNKVLEMLGVTEEMRSYHRHGATMIEILRTAHMKPTTGQLWWNVYQCGSSWEATVTPDLASDIDFIDCRSEPLVVPHRLMAGPGEFLNIVREEWTRPGYVKLQLIKNGWPLGIYVQNLNSGIMHGPAAMHVDERGRHVMDKVNALQCKGIPLFATDWITRHRPYDWPSQHLIDKLKMMGCLFVSVGHFESREKELEWRLSFSLQERELMKSLNITQHRVYVLLKMIKKDVLERLMNIETLSSYHCKTCVFYMVEMTRTNMWVPENMIDCLLQCLTLLLRWINDRFCPSFFLEDSNLFDKEGFIRLAHPLERLIDLLLKTGHQFLYLLQSDHVGQMLSGGYLMLYKPLVETRLDFFVFDLNRKYIIPIASVFRLMTRPHDSDQDLLTFYISKLEEFQHGGIPSGCTEEEYRNALRHALPWLHLCIALEFAARAVTCQDIHEGKELMQKVDRHMYQARNTDLVNVRLAQATILLRLEKLEECFLLLQELENCWTYRVYNFCPVAQRIALVRDNVSEIASDCRYMSLRKHMKTRVASCVIFERSQIALVPSPLRYEMYRSLFTRPASRDEHKEEAWFVLAAVDAKVYLFLLQYIVCSKLNREPHKQIAMDNLASIILHDIVSDPKVLGHRETAFNLLGWIYLQEHRVADAVRCFIQSWQIRPHHNAAKFHVCLLLMEARQNNA